MLFSTITPYRMCKDLAITIYEDEGSLPYVLDPHVHQNRIYILRAEFASKTYNPEFQFGNIIDFYAYINLVDHSYALSEILERCKNILDPTLHHSLTAIQDSVALYLNDMQHIRRCFSTLSQNSKTILNVKSFLNDRNLIHNNEAQFVIPVMGSDIVDVFKEVSSEEFVLKKQEFRANKPYLVYAYYVNYSTISAITAEDLHDGKMHLVYESNYTHGYLGYHTIPPETNTCILCDDIVELANTRLMLLDHSRSSSGVILLRNNKSDSSKHRESKIYPDKLDRAIIHKDKTKNLKNIMAYFTKCQEVHYTKDLCYATYKNSKCCRDYVVKGFLYMLGEKQSDAEKLQKYTKLAFTDQLIKADIVGRLKQTGREDILKWTDEETFSNTKQIKSLGSEVRYTKDGYCITKKEDTFPITNFTITLTEALVFKDSSEIFLNGKLWINNTSLDITLPKQSIQQPYQLLKCITKVVTESDSEDIRLPIVYDAGYNKYLSAILISESNSAKLIFGISNLGWTKDRSQFFAAGWRVNSNSVEVDTSPMHPTNAAFKNYELTPINKSDIELPDGQDFNTLFAIICASLCRSFLGWSTPVINILDRPHNREFLMNATSLFGQSNLFEINTNTRTPNPDTAGFSGFVFVCTGVGKPQKNYNDCVFYLNRKEGLDFECGESLTLIKEYLQDKIPKIINHIIKTDCSFYSDTSDTVNGLISEGQNVIRKIFKLPDFNCLKNTKVER
jgi:uncharacterized protein (UPF0216 family)